MNVWFPFQFVPALRTKHSDILHGITVGSASRERSVYMAALVDWLTADLTAVLCHLHPEIALGITVTVAFSVLVDYLKRFAAYPDVVAE